MTKVSGFAGLIGVRIVFLGKLYLEVPFSTPV